MHMYSLLFSEELKRCRILFSEGMKLCTCILIAFCSGRIVELYSHLFSEGLKLCK